MRGARCKPQLVRGSSVSGRGSSVSGRGSSATNGATVHSNVVHWSIPIIFLICATSSYVGNLWKDIGRWREGGVGVGGGGGGGGGGKEGWEGWVGGGGGEELT